MGSQGPGRKRTSSKNGLTAEEDALNVIAKEAEACLAAKRAARAEAREIRMKELERQQKEEDSERYTHLSGRHASVSDDEEQMPVGSRSSVRADDQLELNSLEKDSSRASTISGNTLTSLGKNSSQRESGVSISADTESSIREIKEIHELKDQIQEVEAKHMQNLKGIKGSLLEAEEKYRKTMVSNAQLDNEKTKLIYEVDTLKDSLMELEEMLYETRHELEKKTKDLEQEKHAHSILQFQFNELKETLKQSEELLTEIRQLQLKQDSFVREFSDLQETIEWKNKKIGALERQKEFSDAIRNERDELRDEVIQLKDILKKHGVVLGPDLTTNGETGEVGDTDQSSGTSSAEIREGSSVLGTHQLKLCKDQNQKDLNEELHKNQQSSQLPLSSTKTPLETNANGNPRDEINLGVELQSDNRPEKPSVDDDELTETKPMDGIKADHLVLEDSENNTVKSECDVHTDGPLKKDQQETLICAKHSLIDKETILESASGPKLENQPDKAKLDNKSTAVEEPVESVQTEKLQQTQCASVSNKKRKKKKKSKQKQKQSDKLESKTKIDDKNEKGSSENNPSQNMESDLEGKHEEHLENDVSTAMNTDIHMSIHDDKRNLKLDCDEISTNINADDAREKFQVVPDAVDSAESSNPISNFDCAESRTGNIVLSEVSVSNLTDVNDDQTEDSTNPPNEVFLEKALLYNELSDKTMDAVDRCVETTESINSSDNIENSLLEDSKKVTSHLDIEGEEGKFQNVEPEITTVPCYHYESAPKNPSSMIEDESETVIQEQPTVPIDQEAESHLQNSIEEKRTQIQQDELQGAIMPKDEMVSGDDVGTAVTEFHVQSNLEKGEEDEEERSQHGQVLPENNHTKKDEADQESLDLGASNYESKLEIGEDGKEGSFQEQGMLETQLPRKDKDILVEKEGEEDENEVSFQHQVMPDTQLPQEDENIPVEKGEEDEKEGSFQHQVMLDKLPQVDESILMESVTVSSEFKADEEEDGESFDFDDMDLEASSDAPLKNCQDQSNEEVTLLKENMQEATCKDYQSNVIEEQIQEDGEPVELADKETEPKNQIDDGHAKENPQTTTEIEAENSLTEDSQVNKKDCKPNQQQDDAPQPEECTSEEHLQASEEPGHNKGVDIIFETETRDVVQECSSSIDHENQEVEREKTSNMEDDIKESKKSSKKGKGKGKEECKMS